MAPPPPNPRHTQPKSLFANLIPFLCQLPLVSSILTYALPNAVPVSRYLAVIQTHSTVPSHKAIDQI